ncbi:hypothetical protein MLD38_025350 [Melastoma candidum]|uniref:Uncharacterized protein n=1 Tax=Melastoma candidum TaxID=119954 RepID=A0ACB9NVJ9_9MYRT|nr:hypothetical protein MLD38_025350 [Melastoma candidum]
MGNFCCRDSGNEPDPAEDKSGPEVNNSTDPAAGDASTTQPPRTPSRSPPPAKGGKPSPIGPVLGRPMEDVKSVYTMGKELGRGQFGATDFGLSVFFKQGDVFKDIVGSAYYIAPEVLKRRYGPEADIWSVGVMLYILLSGVPPFWAESENGIFNAILRGHVDFSSDPWPSISPGAKDLVKKMLNSDPKQRLTAFQVLNHPWIKEDGEAPDTPLDNAVLNRLKQFRAMNQFKKAALRVIAGCLSEEEIMGLKEMFRGMDTDNSGTITLEELKQGLSKQGTKLSESEVKQLMEAADADGNGTIDYDEFIAATMHMNRMDREEHLYTAFQYFDKDNSGYITNEELEQALKEFGMHDGRDMKEILMEVDSDNDGRINYEEFVAMMRKGNPDQGNPKKRRDVFV